MLVGVARRLFAELGILVLAEAVGSGELAAGGIKDHVIACRAAAGLKRLRRNCVEHVALDEFIFELNDDERDATLAVDDQVFDRPDFLALRIANRHVHQAVGMAEVRCLGQLLPRCLFVVGVHIGLFRLWVRVDLAQSGACQPNRKTSCKH